MKTSAVVFVFAIWFVIGCLISYYAKKKRGKGVAEYFIANRKLGGFAAAMTYSATTYSAFMMVGLVGMAYAVGISAMGFELTYLISTVLLLTYFAPKFWAMGKQYNCITPTELLSKRYKSNLLGIIVTVFALIMLVPYMSVQFTGIGYLLQGLAGIPYIVGITIALIVIITYTFWGGMRSVAWTDALQSVIMIIASIVLLLYVILSGFGSFGNFFGTLQNSHPELLSAKNMSYQKFIGLSIPWMFFALTNPQVSQRMFLPKDKKSLKNMVIGFSFFGLIYTFIVVNLGLAAKCIFPNILKTDTVTMEILNHVPTALALIVFISIVAASVSTVDSIILSLSSMCTVDIFGKIPKINKEKQLPFGVLMVPTIAILAFIFALGRFGAIVELSVMSSAGLLATAPAYIGIFWKRATKIGAITSILAGGTTVIILYSTKYFPLGMWPGVWCAIISTLTFILVSLGTDRSKQQSKKEVLLNE